MISTILLADPVITAIANLAYGDIDVALRITDSPRAEYSAHCIAVVDFAYCASPQYLAKVGTPQDPAQLTAHQCLVNSQLSADNSWHFTSLEKETWVDVRPAIRANSSLALLEATLQGQGVAYLPMYLASPHIRAGKLCRILSNFSPAPKYNLYAVYFPSRYQNPRVRALIDFLVASFQGGNPWTIGAREGVQ
ncbi:substrate binding domain-containing protein [Paraburkholderia elongata]